ncbi:MAG: hypothetical protein WD096_02975 [Actinomycetota bacterium]
MEMLVAVGGPRSPITAGSWDLWPIAGIVLALWIGRRMLRMPWQAPLFVGSAAASLAIPVAVHAWGVSATLALTFGIGLALRWVRASASGRPPSGV